MSRAFPCVCVVRVLHCRLSFQNLRCSVYHHHHRHHVGNQQADVFLMRNSSVYGTHTESKGFLFFFLFGFVFYSARFITVCGHQRPLLTSKSQFSLTWLLRCGLTQAFFFQISWVSRWCCCYCRKYSVATSVFHCLIIFLGVLNRKKDGRLVSVD